MRVSIGCMMRDAESYFSRWRSQIERLAYRLSDQGYGLTCVVLENDSMDLTREKLAEFRTEAEFEVVIAHLVTGADYWPSTDSTERWRHLANICERVRGLQAMTESDMHIYAECDLQWDPQTALDLVDAVQAHPTGSYSPLLMCGWDRAAYYDTWGTAGLDGVSFTAQRPFHESLLYGRDFVAVDSVAGMTVCTDEVLKASSWINHDRPECYRTWCASIWAAGYSVQLSTKHSIYHPAPGEVGV